MNQAQRRHRGVWAGQRPWLPALFGSVLILALLPGCNGDAITPVAGHGHSQSATVPPQPTGERSIVYWYDPMHPQYHSDKPGLAPDCGMELVPRYADEVESAASGGTVEISPWKQQVTGIRSAPVSRRTLEHHIRTVGVVRPDETRVQKINTKISGYVEKLYVSSTGEAVERGQAVLSIYSPELLSTQAEYLLALRGEEALHHSPFPEAVNSSKALLDATRRRLLLWDIPADEVKRLEESGKPQKALTLRSPIKGYVTAKDVFEGSYVTAGSDLYTVTDLSRVWVLLDVYEHEMPFVRVGMPVTLRLVAYPGEPISGAVTYVYPYLDEKTRTNKVRVELDNPKLRLKPDMYATAEMSASLGDRLALPTDAVIDSGTEQVVFVAAGDGRFEPRTVRLGERGDGYVEVLDGVREGEQVVVSANFMVDSESRLKAAMDAAGGTHQH